MERNMEQALNEKEAVANNHFAIFRGIIHEFAELALKQ
jgi:hypothetical protein